MIFYKVGLPDLPGEFARIDNRLQALLIYTSGLVDYLYSQHVVVTMLLRSQAEQDRIYGADPAYQARPWKSVHQVGRGVDIRSYTYTRSQIDNIVAEINSSYLYSAQHPTALYHDVGQGAHIHLQVPATSGRQYFI